MGKNFKITDICIIIECEGVHILQSYAVFYYCEGKPEQFSFLY